jgi:hypothetical protein
MVYRVDGQADRLVVRSLLYRDPRARYLLLEWLARHADQVKVVDLRLAPFERPETWMPDLYSTLRGLYSPMGRVIDLAALAGMQVGDGDIPVRVEDALCPWNASSFRLAGVDGRLRIEPAGEAAATLAIQAVAALVYGTHDPGDFAARGWGDLSPEAEATLRAMFPPRLPFLHEEF